jgi:hypothetical protein
LGQRRSPRSASPAISGRHPSTALPSTWPKGQGPRVLPVCIGEGPCRRGA